MTPGDDLPAPQKTRCYHYPKSQATINYTLALTSSKMEAASPQRALPWPSAGQEPSPGPEGSCQQEPCSQKKPAQRCARCWAAARARSWASSSLTGLRGTSSGQAQPAPFLAVTVVLVSVRGKGALTVLVAWKLHFTGMKCSSA